MTASQPPQPPEGGPQPPAGGPQSSGQAHQPPGPGRPGVPPYYGHPQYGQPPYGQQPYGPPPYGQQPYGPPPYGHHPYGPPTYGPPPYGPPPYGPPPYGQQPYAQQYGPPGYPYGRPAGGEFSFDPKRLSRSDHAVAGGTLLFLLLGFLPWWRFGNEIFGVIRSGFDDGMVVSAFVLFLLATGWALFPAFVRTTPTFPRSSVTVGLAGLGLVLTLFAWLDTLRYAFSFWALLALLTAVAITAVATLALRRDLRDRPARPGAAPPPVGYWPGQGGPAQPPAPYPGPPYGAAPGQYPHQVHPSAPPGPPASGHHGPGPGAPPGGPTDSGKPPGATESEPPRTET